MQLKGIQWVLKTNVLDRTSRGRKSDVGLAVLFIWNYAKSINVKLFIKNDEVSIFFNG
jgi:hypothetical protein